MEQNSHSEHTVLEDQIRECYGRVVYSHKVHEKCADILLSRLNNIKLAQIILSAMITAGFVSILFGTGHTAAIIGGIISTALLVINSYTKDYDLGQIAQRHREAATDLWLVREKFLSLLTDMRSGQIDVRKVMDTRDDLLEELHSLYSGAPSTNFKGYKKGSSHFRVKPAQK